MTIDGETIDRFRRDLDALVPLDQRLGLAVSGGPDSLALLVLAARVRPGLIEAATVDHRLRPEGAEEGMLVGRICKRLKVPHQTLAIDWAERPESGIQALARAERYRILGAWAETRGLSAIVTGHHLDDQVETFFMRLARGAGVKGLAAMRPVSPTPGASVGLLRPLLGWRRCDLVAVCASAGIEPAKDPSNDDEQFERVRVRQALAEADWIDAGAIGRSAAHLAAADSALHWATTQVWDRQVSVGPGEVSFDPSRIPYEILWRLVRRTVHLLASEGKAADLRGRELDQILDVLGSGGRATLRGVLCSGGDRWRFVPAPHRTGRINNSR